MIDWPELIDDDKRPALPDHAYKCTLAPVVVKIYLYLAFIGRLGPATSNAASLAGWLAARPP